MGWARTGFLASALLASAAYAQTSSDLSKDPSLQQVVDLHAKRAFLPEIVKYLSSETHTKLLVVEAFEPYMVCVFVKKQPAWRVMQSLADVFGAQWTNFGGGWRLVEPKSDQAVLQSYVDEEAFFLRKQIYQRAMALAHLATTTKWVATGSTVAKEPLEEETPEIWAARVIRDPAYYTAGLMFSRVPVFTGTFPKIDCPVNLLRSTWATAYRLLNTMNLKAVESNQCGPTGPLAPELDGCQILVRTLPWAGTIQAILVDGGSHRTEKPKRVIRYPRPILELADHRAGKWLLDWEAMPGESEEPVMAKPVTIPDRKRSPFYADAKGIEEYLEALADSTGIPVYSDAFRLPVEEKGLPASGQSLASWLNALRDSQHCFVKVKDGNVMIRHGGFWDLRVMEPDETSVRSMELVSMPGINEYADFALTFFPEFASQTEFDLPFFETEQVPLLSFDPKPLCDGYLTLAAYGQWNEFDRKVILDGKRKDTYKSVVDGKDVETVQSSATARNGKGTAHFTVPVEVTHAHAVGWDRFVGPSASLGEFYGGIPVGQLELRLLEDPWAPAEYRDIWGDSPNPDPQFTKNNGPVTAYAGHFLSLRTWANPTEILDEYGKPIRQFGRFTFFTSVSSTDGVLNTVEIPDHRHGR